MKKYLAWKKFELDSPALACPAPLLAHAASGATEWAALASPTPSSIPTGPTKLTLSGSSAFSVVPSTGAPNLPALYPGLMCLPALLDRLGGQNILRSSMSTSVKPIPNNDKVDLARFRVKEPVEWLVDDVVSWMLDVAKRHGIEFDEMNMHRFASLNGQQLMVMTEQDFVDRDPAWGALIYKEFKKLLSEDSLIDDFMKKYNSEDDHASSGPSTSFEGLQPPSAAPQQLSPSFHDLNQALNQQQSQHLNQSIMQGLHSLNSGLAQNLHCAAHSLQQSLSQSLASTLAAGLTTGLSPMSIGLMQNGLSPSSPLLSTQIQPKISPLPNDMSRYNPGSVSSNYDVDERLHGVECKIKKNKDGKPRKRSQHTKGNKLWEFIRDALKDPDTCPSVVRWEDPAEGVFRIVESEKLARLWGERKNNTKMTYEKLSRAMRTYYEKQILVPVPKTGLYPKKLVYKFGPGAIGWDRVKEEIL